MDKKVHGAFKYVFQFDLVGWAGHLPPDLKVGFQMAPLYFYSLPDLGKGLGSHSPGLV
jgi:hypothetical protein